MQQHKALREAITTVIGFILVLGLTAGTGKTQTSETATTTTSGNWTDASTWTCTPALSPCVPNNTGYDVVISNGYSVELFRPVPTTVPIDSLSVTGGSLGIGGGVQEADTVLEVGGKFTNAGSVALTGGIGSLGGAAVLDVAGAAPSSLTASLYLFGGYVALQALGYGDAVLNYGSGAITQIGGLNAGSLTLIGSGAFVEVGGLSGNTALASLSAIASNGSLSLQGGTVATNVSLANEGNIEVGPGSGGSISIGGSLTNAGGFDLNGGQSLYGEFPVFGQVGGKLTNTGDIFLAYGTLSVAGDLANPGDFLMNGQGGIPAVVNVGGNLTNSGNLDVDLFGAALNIEGNMTNSGNTNVFYGGAMTVNGALHNTGAVDIEGSTIAEGSTLDVGGSVTNDASITAGTGGALDALGRYVQSGSSSQTLVEGTLSAASLDLEGGTYNNDTGVTNLGSISGTPPSGSINIGSNGMVTDNATIDVGSSSTPGTVNNAGAVTVGRAGTMMLADGGSYTQTGGATDVNGTLIASNVAIDGGVLSGTGTVEGATTIDASARLSPGVLGIGTMKFNASPSPISLDLLGTWDESIYFRSLFSAADITGELSLGPSSVLDILLLPIYDPKVGTSFTIADFGSLSGTFGSILNDTFDNGKEDWIIAYNSTDIVLTAGAVGPDNDPPPGDPPAAAPEPSSLTLIALGASILGLVFLFRRNTTKAVC